MEQFERDLNKITTSKVDAIDMVAAVIGDELEMAVTTHLNLEPMKRIISSNALESFNLICDSKTPEIIQRVESTAKAILADDIWLKTHCEAIALGAVTFEKYNLLGLVNTIVNSNTTHRLIDTLAKTACNGYAAMATTDFADEEYDNDRAEDTNDNQKSRNGMIMQSTKEK